MFLWTFLEPLTSISIVESLFLSPDLIGEIAVALDLIVFPRFQSTELSIMERKESSRRRRLSLKTVQSSLQFYQLFLYHL